MSALLQPADPIRIPDGWPAELDLILSALEAGEHRAAGRYDNRRVLRRLPHRVRATLRLFSDGPEAAARVLYTRDVSARGLGFLTPHRLPLGYGGTLTVAGTDGVTRTVQCTVLRCREATPGWYEGSVYFNREQAGFEQSPNAQAPMTNQ